MNSWPLLNRLGRNDALRLKYEVRKVVSVPLACHDHLDVALTVKEEDRSIPFA